MTKYTQEKKEHAWALMSAPHNRPVVEVSKLTGIAEATLYFGRKKARNARRAVPDDGQNSEAWSASDKFAVVLETAPLGEAELTRFSQVGLICGALRTGTKSCTRLQNSSVTSTTCLAHCHP